MMTDSATSECTARSFKSNEGATSNGLLALALFAVAAVPRFAWAPLSYLNTHASRDLYRAKELLAFLAGNSDTMPLAGAELYFGGRVPGFFYYILTAIPLAIWDHPYAVAFWMALLAAIAAPVTFLALKRLIGREGAIAATLLYALFPLCVMEQLYLWNPSYLPLICACALYCFTRWISRDSPLWWSGAILLGLLGMQIHLSAYTILIVGATLAVTAAIWRPAPVAGDPATGNDLGFRLPGLMHWMLPLALILPLAFAYLWTEGHFFFMDIRLPEQGTSDVGLLQRGWNWGAFKTIIRGFIFFNDAGAWQQFQHFGHPLELLGVHENGSHMSRLLYQIVVGISSITAIVLGLASLGGLIIFILPNRLKVKDIFCRELSTDNQTTHLTVILLLGWIVVPTAILIKMTGSVPGADPLGIPTRYIVIFYPAAMALLGLGFAGLRVHSMPTAIRRTASVLLSGSLCAYALILAAMGIAVWQHGEIFRYSGAKDQIARPLFVEAYFASILRDEYKLSEEQFLTHFLSSEQFQDEHAEQYLDYFHFGPPEEDNPEATQLYFYLHDAINLTGDTVEIPPYVLQHSEIVAQYELRDLVLYVLRRVNPANPAAWPNEQLVPLGVR